MDYLGKWVSVYFNLHKNIFSIQRKGLVVDHVRNVKLLEAKFAVQPAGHAKVLVEKKKNVHAYVRGYITHVCDEGKCLGDGNWSDNPSIRISYNPYKADYFYNIETGEPVNSVDMALLELTERNTGKITGFFKV